MPTTLFVQQQHLPQFGPEAGEDYDVHFIHHPKALYIISEHDYVRSLIPSAAQRKACEQVPFHRIGTPLRQSSHSKVPRPLMATLTYTTEANMALGRAPGSPPDLTNSKSSRSSSLHSSTLSDMMGPSDLSHFEDINLDDQSALGPSSFHVPASPNRVVFEASFPSSRSTPHPQTATHSFRDLTANSKSRYPSLRGHVNNAVGQQSGLNAPGKSLRRGFTSPSAPSLANITNLAAPTRRSRSPSPSHPQAFPSAPRSLSRRSSRNLEVSPSRSMDPRRRSWQHGVRKTAKEREAECDDEDDEVPDDAIIWNVPISPRPAQERSPAPSTCGSPPQTSPSPPTSRPVSQREEPTSTKTSPAISQRHFSPHPLSPNPANRENYPPTQGLTRQRTNTWEDTYTTLDEDAKKLTEALEEYQSEFERQQEVKRQQPNLSRSSSTEQHEPKAKTRSLPPLRKSDPLIDPFQPSTEKQKYLSRTRPSWLPPKNPKEEKKHLKEYQKMLARIEEAERLDVQRQETEALAREKAERVKAEYWSNLLLPNWESEMINPQSKGTHRKMWWNGIPPKLRGTIWKKAIGNDLEITETTFKIALETATSQIKELGDAAFDGRVTLMIENTKQVFPSLKMFAPVSQSPPSSQSSNVDVEEEQPLHQDLLNVCLAYSSYRSDVSMTNTGIHHVAGLFLLNMSVVDTFIALSNLLNRALPLSFLVRDNTAITAAYDSTLSALNKKYSAIATRLADLRVEPRDYLESMFSSLFCERLGLEHAARVMDVYAIEGDKIPPRVAVGVLGILEGGCYQGGVEDVVSVLNQKEIRESPDEFMGRVYEAGKSS